MKRNILNKILLLRLIQLSKNITSFQKVRQMVFIIQQEGRKERRTTFNYEFVQWNYEPYSKELEEDFRLLDVESLITKNQLIELSEKGMSITNKMQEIYQRERVDALMKFFTTLHMSETLYETANYIKEKYQIVKYNTDEVICEVIDVVIDEFSMDKENRPNGKLDENENEERETFSKVKKFLSKWKNV